MQTEIRQYDIRQAVYADWNYKIDNKDILNKLVLNILNDGLLSFPIVRINEDGQEEVIDGNHRKQAIECILNITSSKKKKLNSFEEKVLKLYTDKGYAFSTIPVVYVGEIPLVQAKKISIKLNETRFESDPKLLGQTLIDIVNEYTPEVFDEIPFDVDEYDMLAAAASEESRKRIYDIGDGNDRTFERLESGIRTIKIECTTDTYELFLSCKNKLASLGITTDALCIEIILHEFNKIPLTKIKV